MQRTLFSFLLTFCFTINSCISQTEPLIPEDVIENIKARVDGDISPGIVVALIDKNGVTYYSYGSKSMNGTDKVDEYSVFEIGSISKTFTSLLLADKVIKKQVKLEDPLQQYLPEDITAPTKEGQSIRLVEMANHTSGLPRMPNNFNPADPSNPFADYSEELMYNFLVNYSIPRAIGSQYEYSNYATGLLGYILGKMDNTTYAKQLEQIITKPLGMENTAIVNNANMEKNLAFGHTGGMQVPNWDFATLSGAGAIRSSAVDMVKFLKANMGLEKSNLYPAMQLSHKNTRKEGAEPIVGLGWHTSIEDGIKIIWHNGQTGGYHSYAGFLEDGSKGVVVLANSTDGIEDIGIHLLNPAHPLTEVEAWPEVVEVEEETLANYLGKYALAPGMFITISKEEQQLFAQVTGQQAFPIFASSVDTFYFKVVEAEITFNQNSEGEIDTLTLFQGGRVIPAAKMKE